MTAALSDGIRDFRSGVGFWRLWTTLAYNELLKRYRRSWLGLGWISLSFLLFTGVKIFIFGALSGTSDAYFAGHLTLGYLLFRYITNCVNVGSSTLVSATSWIKTEPLPLTVHLFKTLTNNAMIFGFNALPAIAICVFYGAFQLSHLWVLPILLIVYAINGIWVVTLFSILCARHRDILHFTATFMSIMYFITPILWVAPETGPRAIAARVNPFTHYLDIARKPLLDGTIPMESVIVVAVGTVLGCLVAITTYSLTRDKVVFWV